MTSLSPALLTDDPSKGITVAARGGALRIFVAAEESSAVRTAAENLARDIQAVCGASADIVTDAGRAQLVIGTLGTPVIDAAVADRQLDVDALRDETGTPRWEAFQISASDDTVFLVGTDRRGAVYAIYDFAEAIGVSPWAWWGDVAVRERDHLTVAHGTKTAHWPSVRYRGVFINDEEELFHWAQAHTDDGTIGPATYRRLFELILRLKGNYLWPAMHVGAFNHDPENGRLANELGIVIGSSHCDMLLRSNEHEFGPWAASQAEPVEYDYSLEGRNRELLHDYWRGSVEQNRDYEVTWSVGMRGIHDSGFQTDAIDEDASLTEAEKFDAKIRLLETAITDQRALLSATLGVDASTVPQIFIPYKEVLPFYDAGLQVPEDVTLIWTNDNFGYVRRYPSASERERSGGNGLYYHSSYWSDYRKSYLATSSTPLALMKAELKKAWDAGIRHLWVDNIGGLKPLEQEMEFFLRSAWDAGKETVTADIDEFTTRWIDEKFTGCHGQEAAEIYAEYYQLNNQRKYEHLTAGVFPQVGYGDEAGRRLVALRRLYDRTNAILRALPADERDTFFPLFAVKIHMAYLVFAQFYHADRSTLAHRQGKLAAANRHLELSHAFDDQKRALIHYFNHEMAGGRWSGIFTPESFPPPVMPLHPAGTPALGIPEDSALRVVAWGERMPSPAPSLDFGPASREKWFEVFATGATAVGYEVDADPWIAVSRTAGATDTETRVFVRVEPSSTARSGAVRVVSPATGEKVTITVHQEAGETGTGAPESDGYVSIDASAADRRSDADGSQWVRIDRLGRYRNAAMQSVGEAGATLEYDIRLSTPGAHALHVHRHPTLNATGRMRLGVSVDDQPMIVLESPITDEHRGAWDDAVQDNIEVLELPLPALDAGTHRLRLHAIDPYVTISKLVVHTATPRPTRLGPEFSVVASGSGFSFADGDPAAVDLAAPHDDAVEFYRVAPEDVPLPDQIYAVRGFWDGTTTFRRNVVVPQPRRGAPRSEERVDQDAVIIEQDGVVAFEAEDALRGDAAAWRTAGAGPAVEWEHTQAETNGRTGLALHTAPRGLLWTDPRQAPGLHYRLRIADAGIRSLWLLVKFDDDTDDAVDIAVDGEVLPADRLFSGGDMCTYGLRQVWLWALVADVDLTEGEHTLSLLARKSGLRVDRVYLTTGDELPPIDAEWATSPRAVPSEVRS